MTITAARRFTLDGVRYQQGADPKLAELSADAVEEMRRIGNIDPEPAPLPVDPEIEAKPVRRRSGGAD